MEIERERKECPECGSESMVVQENEEGGFDILCDDCGYCVWGSIEQGWDGNNTLSQQIGFVLEEIKRQLAVAKQYAKPQSEWPKDDMRIIGAYHQGRLQCLEALDSKLREIRR